MADSVPLYAPDLNTLLSSIRIDRASDDTLQEVHRSVRDVRLGLIRKLGRERAFEIAALPYNDTPVTEDEVLRESAVSAETLWVRILLKQRLPELYMDNSSSVNDVYNDEPLSREGQADTDRLEDLKEQLNDLLLYLADEDSSVQAKDRASLCGNETEYLISDHRIGNPCH